MKEKLFPAVIVDNDSRYVGVIGKSTKVNKDGNVMFYPDSCKNKIAVPYRVCMRNEQVQFI